MSVLEKLQTILNSKELIKGVIKDKNIAINNSLDEYSSAIKEINTSSAFTSNDVDGIKYSYSSISAFPDDFKFSPRSGASATYMFANCNKLKSLSDLDLFYTTKATGFLSGCTGVTLSNIKAPKDKSVIKGIFSGATNIAIDNWEFSSGITVMRNVFSNCTGLSSVSNLDLSSVTNTENMFSNCTNLTSISNLNTQNVNNTQQMFSGCTALTTVSGLDLSNVLSATGMFSGCSKLTTLSGIISRNDNNLISAILGDSIKTIDNWKFIESYGVKLFYNCTGLTTITNFSGLKVSIDFSNCTGLTHDSIMVVINGLETVITTQSLTLGSTNLTKLTDDEKKIATDKGWTLA